MRASLEEFFRRYRDAFNAFDARRIAEHYNVPAALRDRSGAHVFDSFEALTDKFESYCQYFHEIGYLDAEFEVGHLQALGETGAVVDLGWTVDTTSSDALAFRSLYVCHWSNGGWRIFCAEAYLAGPPSSS